MSGFRYGRRVGKRSYVSVPLWVPVVFWVFVGLVVLGFLRSL